MRFNDKLQSINEMLSSIDNVYQKMLAAMNLPESVFITLFTILELGEGCLQKDISEKAYTNKKTINVAIKKLEQDGYIILKPEKYPNKQIFLTDEGKKYVQEKIMPLIEIENKVVESMTEQEHEILVKAYKKYITIYKEQVDNFIGG